MVARMTIREQGVARKTRAGVAVILLGLGLVGCGDQGHVARAAAPAPPPTAQEPVNPAIRVITYACADGQTIVAGYPDRETAVVTYKDHAYTLKLARSASGARYTGYGLQWWTKGDHASIAALKAGEDIAPPGVDCTAHEEQPGADTVTRTSFEPIAQRP
jgi:membrane-bound inhibitor of C-type lysozyme